MGAKSPGEVSALITSNFVSGIASMSRQFVDLLMISGGIERLVGSWHALPGLATGSREVGVGGSRLAGVEA